MTDRAKTYGEEITVKARGAFDTLSDDIYPGESTLKGSPTQVLTAILAKQTTARWQLGTCAMGGTVKLKISYDNLLDLAEQVRQDQHGYRWTFDYSTTPWTVNLAAMPSETVAEFRLGRNVASAKIDLSDAEMCTKLYMTVSTDTSSTLYTYENATAQAEWGVIVKTVDVDAEEVSDPAATGAAILAERAQPVAFITLDGYDLKRLTGDDFDRITLGSNCRVILPDFESTFIERVTQISWPDALDQPEFINVSLANNLTPFREQLQIIKKTGAGAKKQSEENEKQLIIQRSDIDRSAGRIALWASEAQWSDIQDTYTATGATRFAVETSGISGIAAGAGITLDQYGRPVIDQQTGLPMFDGTTAGTLYSRINQEKDRISLVVTGTGSNAQINTAGIILAINGGTGHSSAVIEADHIQLDGNTTISGRLSISNNELISDGPLSSTSYLKGTELRLAGTNTYTLTAAQLGNTVTELTLTPPASGSNNYTLKWKYIDGTTFTETFSRATALSGAWSSGTYTVTASPQGNTISTTPTLRLNGNGTTSFSAEMMSDASTVQKSVYGYLHQSGNAVGVYSHYESGTYSGLVASIGVSGGSVDTITGTAIANCAYDQTEQRWFGETDITVTLTGGAVTTQTTRVNVQGPINVGAGAGWADAAGAVVWPGAGTAASFSVTVPASIWGTTDPKTFTLSQSGSYVYASDGTNNVARCSVSSSHSISAEVQSGTYASRADMEAAYPGHTWTSLGSVSTGWRAVKITCGSATKWCFYVGT